MLITEKEAKTKWCPQSRPIMPSEESCGYQTGNRNEGHHEDISRDMSVQNTCLGSGCMMWRAGVWKHQKNLAPQDRTPGVGFCGLAGKP